MLTPMLNMADGLRWNTMDPYNAREYQAYASGDDLGAQARSSGGGWLGWWYRLTAPPEPPLGADFATRDLARRGRIGSATLFLLLALLVIAFLLGLGDPVTLVSSLIGMGILVIAILFNRRLRGVNVSGLIQVALPSAVILLSILGAPALNSYYAPLYDLLAISEVIAASLLAPYAVLIVGFLSVGFTIADVLLQTKDAELTQVLQTSDGVFTVIARPVIFLVIVAVIGFLWASSTVRSIQRADRAEELAELQRREVERTHELEEGVRQLLEVHVRLANGDFNTRAQSIRNPLLWQIGNSLNNLISRLSRFAQADFVLRRSQEEARRLSEAIYAYSSGRSPIWPAPSNTPLDQVVDALRRSMSGRGAEARPSQQDAGSMPYPPPQLPPAGRPPNSMPSSFRSQGGPSQPQPGNAGLPEWLRPLMPGGEQPPAQPPMPQQAPPAQSPQSNGGNPWALDPEANLPDWLRQPMNDDDSGNY
jgi:hypothetical protein